MQRTGGDAGRGRGCGGTQVVVARIAARNGDPSNGHSSTNTNGLVRKGSCGVRIGKRVSADAVVRQMRGRRGVSVVELVICGGTHRQASSRDVGWRRCTGVNRTVVVFIGTRA